MATIYPFKLIPESAVFLTSNFPQLVKTNGTNFPVTGLAYDPTTDESAFWKVPITDYGSGSVSVRIIWYADTASTVNVVWEVQFAAITPDTDTQDVETKSFATLNYVQDTHLGTTGQRVHACTVTVSNTDSLADGDLLFVRIARDANSTNATDDMSGDAILLAATMSYSTT